MTVTIPDALFEKSVAFATRRGETIDQLVVKTLEKEIASVPQLKNGDSIVHLQKTDPEEWIRQVREWADSHDPSWPNLSEYAMSRESIYCDEDY